MIACAASGLFCAASISASRVSLSAVTALFATTVA